MADDPILTPATTSVRVSDESVARALAAVGPAEGDSSHEPDIVLAVGVAPDASPSDATSEGAPTPAAGSGTPGIDLGDVLGAVGLNAEEVLAAHQPSGKAGECTRVPLAPSASGVRLVLLVGTGAGSSSDLRAAGAAVGRACRSRDGLVSVVSPRSSAARADASAAYVEGLVLGGWAPPKWTKGSVVDGARPVREAVLVAEEDSGPVSDAVGSAAVRARATLLARALANVPSNIKNPAWLADRAIQVAARSGLEAQVWDDDDLRAGGFGGLLAVGGGSATPPRLVRLSWRPDGAGEDAPHVVLVGKGITFDSGGVDVKPPSGMLAMKTDMSGAAVVLAVLDACHDLGIGVRVTGLLPLAENALGEGSYRPGDVVTQYGGRTVEIGNTDAEGRIVLADALAWADEHLDPDVVVDVATLTGSARVALARTTAPVYSTDATLRQELSEAGERSGEPLWAFPLVEDYRPALDSEVADLTHVAPSVGGGSITAALFLREFAGRRPWAHLDIAGAGRSDTDTGTLSKGATGYGARTLLSWLERAR